MRSCLNLPAILRQALGLLGLLPLLACAAAAATNDGATLPPRQSNDVVLVQWNVENLFDAADDPAQAGDDEFTPSSWRSWTEERYHQKLERLAEILHALGADIVCLEEVENRTVLEDLNRKLQQQYGRNYAHIVHRDGKDHRGMDIALLTNLDVRGQRWIEPVPEQREVLIADLERAGRPLTVFVNHWKSRIEGDDKTTPVREIEAKAVRAAVDEILSRQSNAAIVVAGDLNSNPDDAVVTGTAGLVPERARVLDAAGGRLLYNLHGELPVDQRGTLYYNKGKKWDAFDNICVSRSLLGSAAAPGPWSVKPGTYTVVRLKQLLNEVGQPKPFRRVYDPVTKKQPYSYGYSDHLPVMVVLTPATP